MGILDAIKKHKENFVKQQQEIGRKRHISKQERKKYNEDLKKAVIQTRRKAYKKEALSSARVKAKIDAQRRYNPTPQSTGSAGSGMSAEARAIIYGSPTPAKQQVMQKIKQQKAHTKKKKKRSKSRTRTIVKYIEKPKPVNAVEELMRDLPQ